MSLQLVLAQVLLLVLGVIGVGTARPDLIVDHGSKAVLALGLTFLLSRFKPKFFTSVALLGFLVCIALLILVLFVGEGGEWGGGKRWLDFGGPLRFQPSEFIKLALVLQLASFFARRGVAKKLISATAMIMLSTVLVLVEPDVGSTVLIFSLGLVLMFAAGVKFTSIGGFVAALGLLALPFASNYLERHPYITERFFGHVAELKDTNTKEATQIDLAHRDMTQGGLYGRGPDGPKYSLPAGHTDMVIASVAFSTGLLGVVTVIFAYWLIVQSGLSVAELAGRIRPMTPEIHAASIMAVGAMFMIVAQAFVNLAVAVGLFPVTGVPLSLVSYGFSSLLSKSVALAVMHSSIREIHAHLGLTKSGKKERKFEPVPAPAD
ncbi:FtsW/RodA/SpoVE family cell cycle protein [Deinococcus yavapaiensis]|uniref:Cell division protein FtsW n=1 Tax=Deinococcus yavapaiensis KR-236 TaxID=694435 RepID=A0A318SGQ1_9DEIO|nr:FtsW/RodA/SpoVE family cell cycle protein [Deinococcus yavapaiensis]PYE56285.1 cell division protein FtsW [Deinococcus yavapaiensis KR-236]